MADQYTIESFTIKENKVDLVDAAHINTLQTSIVNIQTALNRLVQDNGAIRRATSFPGSPVAEELIFRSDLDTIYYRNAANSAWVALAGSLSNVVFSWAGKLDSSSAQFQISTSLDPSAATVANAAYQYIKTSAVSPAAYNDVIKSKFTKISGINTITWRAYGVHTAVGANRFLEVKVDVGGVNSSSQGINNGTTPTWTSNTIDVSGLTNGTTYDITISIRNGSSEVAGGLGSIILIAS